MIRCDNCGSDNRVGAIFCKTCGKRLNLDDAQTQIEDAQRRERRSPKRIFAIVRKVVMFAALVFVVLVLVGIFLGAPMKHSQPVPQSTQQSAQNKFKKFTDREFRSQTDPQVVFSSAEATAVLNGLANLRDVKQDAESAEEDEEKTDSGAQESNEQSGFALRPDMISVEFLASGYVRLVLRSKTFKGIRIYSSLIGRFDASGEMVQFLVQSGKVGKVPMPGPLTDIVVSRIEAAFGSRATFSKMRQAVDYVEINDDEAVVHLKRSDN